MTEQTKQKTSDVEQIKKALLAIIQNIVDARQTIKNVDKAVDDITTLLKNKMTSQNWKDLSDILFYPVDKTTFYNKYLKDYFLDYGVLFTYNEKKDKVFYAGKVSDITDSFSEWKEQQRKNRQAKYEKMSDDDKVKTKYQKGIDRLSKNQLTILYKLVKTTMDKKQV